MAKKLTNISEGSRKAMNREWRIARGLGQYTVAKPDDPTAQLLGDNIAELEKMHQKQIKLLKEMHTIVYLLKLADIPHSKVCAHVEGHPDAFHAAQYVLTHSETGEVLARIPLTNVPTDLIPERWRKPRHYSDGLKMTVLSAIRKRDKAMEATDGEA